MKGQMRIKKVKACRETLSGPIYSTILITHETWVISLDDGYFFGHLVNLICANLRFSLLHICV